MSGTWSTPPTVSPYANDIVVSATHDTTGASFQIHMAMGLGLTPAQEREAVGEIADVLVASGKFTMGQIERQSTASETYTP